MKDQLLNRSILKILNRLDDVYLREATLASEVEIAVDRLIDVNEFADALKFLQERELIEKDATILGDPMWHITGKGKLAVKESAR